MFFLGQNDTILYARSHLGHVLSVGDTVKGYDLERCSFNDCKLMHVNREDLPDVILVKRIHGMKERVYFGI